MQLKTFFISRTKHIYAKKFTVSKSTFKMNAKSTWTFFEILLTYAVICRHRLLHENDIVQNFKKCKRPDVNQVHFRRSLKCFTNDMKNNYPKAEYIFFTGRSIFSYFLRSNC